MKFFDCILHGSDYASWLIGLLAFLSAFLVLRILKGVLMRRLLVLAKKTRTTLNDVLTELLARTKLFFLFTLSLYVTSLVVVFPPQINGLIEKIIILAVFLQTGMWGAHIATYLVKYYIELEEENETSATTSGTALIFLGKLLSWSLVLMLALENLGFNISALVTGLGIGGIALALAMQNILGDIFASLSIMLDKPFVVGDFINVGQENGSVEYIGLKTTRLKSLSGEQLIFSNSDLLKSRIRNFKRMYERRVVFSFGVTYQTPHDKLAAIPHMIRLLVESQKSVRFERAHFKEYGDCSLNFEVVYWVSKPDYITYMDIQQDINLKLHTLFDKEEIEFAYPTHTVFLSQE